MRDFQIIVRKVVSEAQRGRPWACKLLFSYLLGDPQPFDFLERLEKLKARTLQETTL